MTNNTKSATVQRNSWSGISEPGDLDIDALTRVDLAGAFDAVSGSDYEYLQSEAFHIDIKTLSDIARTYPVNELPIWKGGSCSDDLIGPNRDFYCASTDFTNEKETTETTESAYFQSTTDYDGIKLALYGHTLFELDMPTNVRTGFRYERTDVLSSAYVPTVNGTAWEGKAEFTVDQSFDPNSDPVEDTGSYGILLPNLDIKRIILLGTDGLSNQRQIKKAVNAACIALKKTKVKDPGKRVRIDSLRNSLPHLCKKNMGSVIVLFSRTGQIVS